MAHVSLSHPKLTLEAYGQSVGGIGVSTGTEDEDTEVTRASVTAFGKG